MEQSELLQYIAGVLERMGLRYFVTGSIATIFFGEPRFTNDIDIVVDLPADRINEFCSAFPESDFYVSEESVRRAVRQRSQFNILHSAAGLKVDIMIPAATPFNASRFARVRMVPHSPNHEAPFASPEDVILKKLEYYREGGSEKHLRDIAGVLKVIGSRIDHAYISDWAERLGLTDEWLEVLRRVQPEKGLRG